MAKNYLDDQSSTRPHRVGSSRLTNVRRQRKSLDKKGLGAHEQRDVESSWFQGFKFQVSSFQCSRFKAERVKCQGSSFKIVSALLTYAKEVIQRSANGYHRYYRGGQTFVHNRLRRYGIETAILLISSVALVRFFPNLVLLLFQVSSAKRHGLGRSSWRIPNASIRQPLT